MKNIIQISDIQRFKHIATAFNGEKNLDGYIAEAQMADLKTWLGDALTLELSEQRASQTLSEANRLLLEGGTYIYEGISYVCEGLIAYMAYSVHARYVFRSAVNITQYGAVVKESDYSTPANTAQIREIKASSEATAEAVKLNVLALLRRKRDDYPLYSNGCRYWSGRRQTFNIVGE